MDDRRTPGRMQLRSFSSPRAHWWSSAKSEGCHRCYLVTVRHQCEVETEAGGVSLRLGFAEGFTSGVGWGRRDGTILELTRLVSDQLATWTRHTTSQIDQINTLFFWLQVTTHIEEYSHLVLSGKGSHARWPIARSLSKLTCDQLQGLGSSRYCNAGAAPSAYLSFLTPCGFIHVNGAGVGTFSWSDQGYRSLVALRTGRRKVGLMNEKSTRY
jgi:hypothetical protein